MNKSTRIALLVMSCCAVALGYGLTTTNIDPVNKYSWSENFGHMNWRDADGTNAGVEIGSDFLSGMVWFENSGWMNVGDGAGPYANTTGLDFGVNVLPSGDLDGFAWAENLGWANFGWAAGTADVNRARVDTGASRLRGYAWMENGGWVNLDDSSEFVGFEPSCVASSAAVSETLALPGDPENPKNRFLSFTAGDVGQNQAVRITFVSLPPLHQSWNGAELWVGPATLVSMAGSEVAPIPGFSNFNAARLSCTPYYGDFASLGVVHVFHEGIVPDGDYRIEIITEDCDTGAGASYSGPLNMTTSLWGDTVRDRTTVPNLPSNGSIDVVDALAVLDAFASTPTAIAKARADLEPACLDLKINISDVLASIAGFSGLNYAFPKSAVDPCNSTCMGPIP